MVDPTGEFAIPILLGLGFGVGFGWDLFVNQGYGRGGHNAPDTNNVFELWGNAAANDDVGHSLGVGAKAGVATLSAYYVGTAAFAALPQTVTTLGTLSKVGISGSVAGQAYRATDNVLYGRNITHGLGRPQDLVFDYAASVTLGGAFMGIERATRGPRTWFNQLAPVQRFRAWDARITRQLNYQTRNLLYSLNPRSAYGARFLREGGVRTHEGNRLYTGRNSHVIQKHVGQSDNALRNRSIGPPVGPRDVSTFESVAQANYYIARTLDQNASRISNWIRTGSGGKRFRIGNQQPFETSTGRSFNRPSNTFSDTHNVLIVLEAMPTYNGYTFVTAYPSVLSP